MILFVKPEIKANELIRHFNEIYPFLRLEIHNQVKEKSDSYQEFNLGDFMQKKIIDGFEILPEMNVSEVECLFRENMGIQISIFRKSGKTWLESSFTNYWSLERQNNLGKGMNDFMKNQPLKVIL
jgi:hypothetical protein